MAPHLLYMFTRVLLIKTSDAKPFLWASLCSVLPIFRSITLIDRPSIRWDSSFSAKVAHAWRANKDVCWSELTSFCCIHVYNYKAFRPLPCSTYAHRIPWNDSALAQCTKYLLCFQNGPTLAIHPHQSAANKDIKCNPCLRALACNDWPMFKHTTTTNPCYMYFQMYKRPNISYLQSTKTFIFWH